MNSKDKFILTILFSLLTILVIIDQDIKFGKSLLLLVLILACGLVLLLEP